MTPPYFLAVFLLYHLYFCTNRTELETIVLLYSSPTNSLILLQLNNALLKTDAFEFVRRLMMFRCC